MERLLIERPLPGDDDIRPSELLREPACLHHDLDAGTKRCATEGKQAEPEPAGRAGARLVLEIDAQVARRHRGEVPQGVIQLPDVIGRGAFLRAVRGARSTRPAERSEHSHAYRMSPFPLSLASLPLLRSGRDPSNRR